MLGFPRQPNPTEDSDKTTTFKGSKLSHSPITEPSARTAPLTLSILEQIRDRIDQFTPRQRQAAEYILQNPEDLAFMSIADLSRQAGVSQATIVRFCNTLGL